MKHEPDPARNRPPAEADSDWSRHDSAIYIEELCTQLSEMARRQEMAILSYLLELARAEAGMTARAANEDSGETPEMEVKWRG